MYVPEPFRELRPERLFDFIDRYSFATLVSSTADGPFVTHLPFLLDRARGPKGTLAGHVARPNPHWHHFAEDPNVLVVFTGPHTYVSPSWYVPNPRNVPTWNYAVVHARGRAELTEPGRPTLEALRRLTAAHEIHVGGQYVVRADDAALEQASRGLVAFEIEVEELIGKFKLSQNQPDENRQRVLEHLSQSEEPEARAVADLMNFYPANAALPP